MDAPDVQFVYVDAVRQASVNTHATASSIGALDASESAVSDALPIRRHLEQLYWWAHVHPNAMRLFEREWLVNAILFGNYRRLRDAALDELGETISGRTLHVACVYGDLTRRHLAFSSSARFFGGLYEMLVLTR
ncbi:MAG: hypothetical protein JNJ42_05615 [Burkholderiaceae bacterium]|nr:hypothetical protein [Burkholderiaceae bacterium]